MRTMTHTNSVVVDPVPQTNTWGRAAVLPEPLLEFRYSQRVFDPRDGLSLFGPFDSDSPGSPKNISYGIVGTARGLAAFRDFSKFLLSPTVSAAATKNPRLWPAFPGFDVAFG